MKKQILVADDLSANRRILRKMLSDDYEIIEAGGGIEARDILRTQYQRISAVLLDISMPDMDGFEVLREMRVNPLQALIPVIMITGSEDEKARVKSLELGANDFVMKPYNSEIIKHCLRNNIRLRETASLINELERDKLTRLYTRDTFIKRAGEMIGRKEPGYYIMTVFDVDKFKVINDQHGTTTGDALLKHIANVFKNGFEPHGGLCCRISGDIFAVLYPNAFRDTKDIQEIRLRASHLEGIVVPIVFSIGRYVVDDLSIQPSAMIDRAMIAADSVKSRYDDKIAYYDDAMRAHLLHEQEVVMEMEGALNDRQFEVWFQPQANHSAKTLIGAEALVRWRHPTKGLIPPSQFIPIFEDNGFIYQLDMFVWEETCAYLRKWIDKGRNPLPVSVNISRHDLFRADIIHVITGIVEKYDIPTEMLRLEITETAFSESASQIIAVVRQLIDRGFTVEIDDFGSGYSSLNTLKDVPAQILKLDMRFLENQNSERGGNIVESVVRMAKWLNMAVIAEGVETVEHADFLRSVGCSYIQGYLYAKPMPANEYEAFCLGAQKQERLLTLDTVENLDNNAFWDPKSMDTLIFNSYVGGACIYEYHNGGIELIRATEKYAQVIGSAGMTVEEALKLNWVDHLDEENRKRMLSDLNTSIATKKEVTGEYVFLDLPGCPRETYLRSTMRVIASAGARYLVYCTNENITAQRQAERKERILAKRLQVIMDNIHCGVSASIPDEQGIPHIIFANEKYYSILGYSQQDALTLKDIRDAVHPDDWQKAKACVDQLLRDRIPCESEFRCVKPDGSVIYVHSNKSVVSMDDENEIVVISVVTDITQRVMMEREARETAEQLQNTMDEMPGGFARLRIFPDGSMKPVFINEGFCRNVGMRHDKVMQVYQNDSLSGVHPDDIAAVQKVVAEMFERREPVSFRCRLICADGYEWFDIYCRLSVDAKNDTYIVSYYTNVSEKIKEEERQRELLDHLPGGAGIYEYKDGNLSVLYLNKSYWELVGRNADDYAAIQPTQVVHPDDVPVIFRELLSAIDEGRDVSCDIRLYRESRGYFPTHLAGRVTPRDESMIIYVTFSPIARDGLSYQEMLPLLLSAMMESTTDLSFAKDTNFRYLSASRAFAEMACVENERDVIGKTDFDLFDAELAQKFRRDDTAMFANEKAIVDMIEPIPAVDGVPHYSSTSKYLLRGDDGKVIGLYGVGRDITKTIEQDSQLSLINESIPGGLATYICTPGEFSEKHIKLAYFNDGFCKLFGFTREGYEKHSSVDPTNLIFAEDRPIIARQWLSHMEHATPIDCVYRVHVLSGGYKWISHKAVAAKGRDGSVVSNAILQDVTEQRELIEQLRITEEENVMAMSLGANVICRYVIKDKTLTISEKDAEAFAIPRMIQNVPEEPIRLGLIAPESADAYTGFFASIRHGAKVATATFQQRYFENWRWMEARSSTIFSDDGKPVKALISMTDVTEQMEKETIYKKWQQSLTEKAPQSYTLFRCNLNHITAPATREGDLISFDFNAVGDTFSARAREYATSCVFEDDRDLYIAFANADAMLAGYYRAKRSDALEYRELYPGGMRWLRLSVDLVEYPNSTDVEAYLLYEDIDEAKRAELLTKERSQTDPLTGLLNRTTFITEVGQLLRQSKPGTKNAMLMIDIDGFKRVNDVFGHGTGDQTLVDIAGGLMSIVRHDDLVARLGGDEFMVFLADIQNDNAASVKAKQICEMAQKSFSMEVQISCSVGITISPRDGMDFETLYKKADSALYYVKGSGKNNYVFYHDSMADEHLLPEKDEANPLRITNSVKKRRMLIVDDNSIDYALLQNIFKDEFIIEKAKDGETALIRLRHYGSAISVVLLDLMMPGMDGFAVLERMQLDMVLKSIPVLIVSGDDSRETCLKAIRQGATDFITKPVDPDILRVRVHSAVSKAENERLRAVNSLLKAQREERTRFESALDSAGISFIEYDWLQGTFTYYPSISRYIDGTYDERMFWRILLSDMVADTPTVEKMQQYVHSVAEKREKSGGSIVVKLNTPKKEKHRFRMTVRKVADEYDLTNKLIIALDDLDYTAE